MIGTFAGQLEHFAHAVDIVDDATFDRVRGITYQYVRREFKDAYFELLRESTTGNGEKQTWLNTFWSSTPGLIHRWPIQDTDGNFRNPITVAFGSGRPLWLVSADKGRLDDASKLCDEWSSFDHLPPYKSSGSQSATTAIIVPLIRHRVAGAYYIETSKRIDKTDVGAAELNRLGEALAILFELYDVNRTQSECTSAAINDLSELLTMAKFPKTALPHFFFAFPDKGDEEVLATIRGLLNKEYTDQLDITDWQRVYDSGDVPRQIAVEISESAFGACYLSEPDESDDSTPPSYRDNPNVIFEAGMLHARTTASSGIPSGEPSGWFPIREKRSPRAPFDFQNERILIVPRNQKSGELLRDEFRELLKKRIDRLIG